MSWLDSTWCAVCSYLLVVVVALGLGVMERARRRSDAQSSFWPTFWFVTAGFVLAMAIGRASDTGALLADLGRERARSQGWYETRRSLQAVVVAAIAVVWAVAVGVAIWRVPERRRRYLPTSLAVVTLVCYVGVRLISLHQVDALLYNRDVGGVRVGAIIELALVGAVIAISAYRFRETPSGRQAAVWQP